jgi:hypothetical protein
MNAFDKLINGVFVILLKAIGIMLCSVIVIWLFKFAIGLVRDILALVGL